ncbi:hypothetical protein MHBO_002722, partial [Bonamia ostreae]
ITKRNDLYIKGFLLNEQQTQKTDIHLRTKTTAQFNWRMIFQSKYPIDNERICLQIWDKDFLSPNV